MDTEGEAFGKYRSMEGHETRVAALRQKDISIEFRHVPAHVGVYGNERADRLAKAANRRAHLAHDRTDEQREDQALNALADSIVAAILNR